MKTKTGKLCLLMVLGFMLSNLAAYSQANNSNLKVKTRIIHEEKIEKGKSVTSIESEEKYDLKGNLTEEIQYKDGKVDKHIMYEYDSDNNKIKETELDNYGKPKKIGEFKYINGLRTEKLTYDGSKKLISKKVYTYTY